MYEMKRKLEFIDGLEPNTVTKESFHSLFCKTEPFESRFAKDLSEFSLDEANELISNSFGVKFNSRRTLVIRIRTYIRWCKSRGYHVSDAFDLVDFETSALISSSLIFGPEHLKDELDKVFRPDTEESTDEQYRALFWLAFAGIPSWEAALSLKAEDIDFDEMTVRYNGVDFKLYVEGLRSIRNVARLSAFIQERYNKKRLVDRYQSDQLLRGIQGELKTEPGRVRLSKLYKKRQDEGREFTRLTFENVYTSGVFYLEYKSEMRTGMESSFVNVVEREMILNGINKKSVQNQGSYYQKISDYKKDYACWKRAMSERLSGRN